MNRLEAALAILVAAWPAAARGEVAGTPLVDGLKTPTKIVLTKGGSLFVVEIDTGRIVRFELW